MALARGRLIRFRRSAPADVSGPDAGDVIAALPVATLLVDPEDRMTDANVAAETLLNASRSAIAGRPLVELIGDAIPAAPLDAPLTAYDMDLVLPDGRRRRVDLMVTPLPEHTRWRIVTIHDRASVHLAGRRADRGTRAAIGAAAMLAHEIKNPLSGIRGAAQLLEANVDAGGGDLTRLIRDEVDRVAALIDRMEGFTDTRPVEVTPQNIHAILAHAREVALRGFAAGRFIRELYDPSLPAVLGHRDSLVQVMINLLKNAAEATAETGGPITLRTAYRHGVTMRDGASRLPLPIEVAVIDEGPGAPPELADHLFEPFVSTRRSGSGLGLALVDKLVADQGGIVEYAREGTPPCTVFRLLLPRAREADA